MVFWTPGLKAAGSSGFTRETSQVGPRALLEPSRSWRANRSQRWTDSREVLQSRSEPKALFSGLHGDVELLLALFRKRMFNPSDSNGLAARLNFD
jgi:hypothetical protein